MIRPNFANSFFFQPEDGRRDGHVTGVQTCALPIWMQELTRRMPSAMSWGVEAELLSPAEIQQLVPYCDAGLLVGGFHTPTGAIVDPIRAGELMREHAHQLGALTVCAETEVIDVEVSGGRVTRVEIGRAHV